MGFENSAGLGVHNFFGPRGTRAPKGGIKTEGSIQEMTFDIWGSSFSEDYADYNKVLLPKGALIVNAFAHVSEVFVLGGTDPVIAVGTKGTEATNGVSIDEAEAEAVGVVKLTPTGTWASALTEDTEVSFALGGTLPTVTDAGKVRVTVRYVKLGINPDAAAGAKGQGSI